MNISTYEKFIMFFRGSCWTVTVFLLCYWIYIFSLDEDICLVDYKEYYDTPTNTYPMLSLCLKNPFKKEKLATKKDEFNSDLYLDFLRGTYFSYEMANISYKRIQINISEYINQYWFEWRNSSHKTFSMSENPRDLFRTSFSGFYGLRFYSCYSLQLPQDKDIMSVSVELKTDIYPFGIRDRNYSTLTFLHSPNQFLTAGNTLKLMFPLRKANDSYIMRFKIRGVEYIRRRNKRSYPCIENWKNYDSVILEEHARKIGCTPPYHDSIDGIPVCSTKNQIAASKFSLRFDDYGTQPPCEGIERIYYSFEENSLDGTEYLNKGYFWVGPYIYDPKFKDIKQKRAIDFHGLIGYIGGYIGLFLGYSIIQIPDFLSVIANNCYDFFVENKFTKFKICDCGKRYNK